MTGHFPDALRNIHPCSHAEPIRAPFEKRDKHRQPEASECPSPSEGHSYTPLGSWRRSLCPSLNIWLWDLLTLPPSNHPSIREQCRVEENGEENGVTTSSIYSYTLGYLVLFTLFLKWGVGGGLLV